MNSKEGTAFKDADKAQISDMWNYLLFTLGINTTRQAPADLNAHLLRMTAYVLQQYPYTTLEEIKLAYDLAVAGTTDVEVIAQLSPLQFGKVVAAYRQYADNNLAVARHNARKLPELPESEENVTVLMKSALEQALTMVRAGESYEDFGSGLYDWLDSLGLIPYTPERKWEFFKAAKGAVGQLISSDLAGAAHLSSYQKAPLRKAIKAVLNDTLDAATVDRIRAHAKYLALNELLQDVLAMGLSAEEFLADALNQTHQTNA